MERFRSRTKSEGRIQVDKRPCLETALDGGGSLKNSHGHGMGGSVTEGEMDPVGSTLLHQLRAIPMQDYERFTTGFATDFDILPPKLSANARAEGFRNRLFRGEAGGEEGAGHAMGKTILDFFGVQDARDEPFAKFFVRRLDSANLDDVHASPKNHKYRNRVFGAEP